MSAARSALCSVTFASRSATSTLPASSHATTTTRMPAMTADAALVPWADDGMRHTSRCASPRDGVVAADREQPGQLALRAGVGLQRHAVVAGDVAQPRLERRDELPVALRLLERRERVELAELRPGDRGHLGGGVQLHRAAAERDHRAIEGDVLVGQRPQVAQHLGLRTVRGEHRVREELGSCGRSAFGIATGAGRHRASTPKAAATRAEHVVGGGLVDGDPHRVVVDAAQVHIAIEGGGQHGCRRGPGTRTARVSK